MPTGPAFHVKVTVVEVRALPGAGLTIVVGVKARAAMPNAKSRSVRASFLIMSPYISVRIGVPAGFGAVRLNVAVTVQADAGMVPA